MAPRFAQLGRAHRGVLRHARIDVRAVRHQPSRQLQAVHGPGPYRTRIVVALAALAHPRHFMQRRPALCGCIRIGARLQQDRRQLEMRAAHGQHQRAGRALRPLTERVPTGIDVLVMPRGRIVVSFTLAPAFNRARAVSIFPSRTANSSAVNPPVERAPMSAPCRVSASTTGVCPSAAAHISAVCPRDASFTFTFAPVSSSTFTASSFPVRAARHQGGFPFGQRRVRIGARLQQQPDHRRIPVDRRQRQRRHADGGSPPSGSLRRRSTASAVPTSSMWAAQCSGVAPSGSGAFTSARRCAATPARPSGPRS